MKTWARSVAAMALTLAVWGVPAEAAVRECRVSLGNGHVQATELIGTVGKELGLPAVAVPFSKIDLTGPNAEKFCRQLNDALSPGCRATIDGGTIRFEVDRSTLPTDAWSLRRATRLLLTGEAAMTKAERYGLVLPADYDAKRPLVLLIHGMDSDSHMWGSMVKLLQADGHQVASFAYPDDGAIDEAGMLLADGMADWRIRFPDARPMSVIAHSMGGLVTRHYVEGAGYRGGVERLIMLGTPNHGSTWTGWRWATEWNSQYKTCQRDGNWSWSKLTEDGNGEAATDLKPGSTFLTSLNALPRREGIAYTIVAGNRSAVRQVGADWLACTADWTPKGVWGLRQAHEGMAAKAADLRQVVAECDGPVTLDSAKLDGVEDFVVVSADHTSLACGQPPAAWDVIRERLKSVKR